MRRFEYGRIQSLSWDMDILSLIAGIYRANGKEEVLLSQSPAILDSLVELAKVQSTEASNAIEGIVTTSTRLRQWLTRLRLEIGMSRRLWGIVML